MSNFKYELTDNDWFVLHAGGNIDVIINSVDEYRTELIFNSDRMIVPLDANVEYDVTMCPHMDKLALHVRYDYKFDGELKTYRYTCFGIHRTIADQVYLLIQLFGENIIRCDSAISIFNKEDDSID